jgi:hypothetical protein
MRVTTRLTRNWRLGNALLALAGLTLPQGAPGQSSPWVQSFAPLRTMYVSSNWH